MLGIVSKPQDREFLGTPRKKYDLLTDTPSRRSAANRGNAHKRWGNREAAEEAARDLLAARIKELVDAAPPLTEDQRRRLTAIIRAGVAE